MWILFAAIVLLGVFAAIAGRIAGKHPDTIRQKKDTSKSDQECCGMHAVCEKSSLLATSSDVIYYDDYELDKYKNRHPSSYVEDELSEFEEIFYTLKNEDVSGWVKSLQLRGIELPYTIRDEVIMIIDETRLGKN